MEKRHEKLADRLAQILIKLNQGMHLDIKQLAGEFEVSERTLLRDFTRLSSCLPLQQDPKTKKFYLESYCLGMFKERDVQAFAQLSGIQQLYPAFNMAFLRDLLSQKAAPVYSVKGHSYEDATQFNHYFEVFSQAIAQKCKVSFFYNGDTASRLVEPYRLIHHQGNWYLAAVHLERLRTYRLSRIDMLEALHEADFFQPDSTILQQVEDEESIWIGQDKSEVILTVHADVAFHFKQRALLPEQQTIRELDDGGLLLSSKINHTMQLLPLVRYWLPHIKIVSPESLQLELERGLHAYLGHHCE